MIGAERVDYIRVPVTDIDAANRFYGELLGLRLNPNSPHEDWVEYEAGNVTLAVMSKLGVAATVRASFYLYSIRDEVDRLVEGLHKAKQSLG